MTNKKHNRFITLRQAQVDKEPSPFLPGKQPVSVVMVSVSNHDSENSSATEILSIDLFPIFRPFLIKRTLFMKNGHNYYVYIVECSDGKYYTGVTNDVERRVWEHNTGYNMDCFTYKRRPVVLKYDEHFTSINNAIAWEKQIKGWSRAKKEALFQRNWKLISELAKSKENREKK